jgi:rRNA small subunit pseudouridine methyltransferase Nep1
VQLLQQGEIRGASDSQVLMRILDVSAPGKKHQSGWLTSVPKHPISHYLPANTMKIGERYEALKLIYSMLTSLNCYTALSADARPMTAHSLLRAVPQGSALAVFVGAMAKGPDDFADGIVDQKVSLSRYPLSASVVCGKVRDAYLALRLAFGHGSPRLCVLQMCCAMEDLCGIL